MTKLNLAHYLLKKLKRYGYNADNDTLLKIVRTLNKSEYIKSFFEILRAKVNDDKLFETLSFSKRQRTLFYLRLFHFYDETALSKENFRDRYYVVNCILNYAKKKGDWTSLNN